MPETEKLTINSSPVDVGQIELLVEQGFYANRAEFIRLAIRDPLGRHADVVRDAGQKLSLRVVGLLVIRDDVPPALAKATIEPVKDALAGRMTH